MRKRGWDNTIGDARNNMDFSFFVKYEIAEWLKPFHPFKYKNSRGQEFDLEFYGSTTTV